MPDARHQMYAVRFALRVSPLSVLPDHQIERYGRAIQLLFDLEQELRVQSSLAASVRYGACLNMFLTMSGWSQDRASVAISALRWFESRAAAHPAAFATTSANVTAPEEDTND